ncbi:cell division protein FtsA [Bacillus alkalicellulosilyticus]|uniref:cell division protein FtsA n=1 Tax=Alkalihalobacterium alkalicellulosilyticum TaxID=1912214 RepID=UPI000997E35D|nr:cell division protein FtsA [Bacillus alkalicellulosilyticus]
MNNNEIYVSLDIGTSNVRVVIGEMTNGTLNIIGVGNTNSHGIKKGSIVDIDETVNSIKRAVDKAERMVGLSIKQVIVGVNGNHIQLQPCHGVVAVSSPDREIGDEDINRVIDASQVLSIPPERAIIDVISKQFIVDGLDEITDPRGMIGVRLEMEGTIITASKTVLHNLLRCVEKAGLEVAYIAYQPLAAGSVAISKDEKSIGVGLIDIGGGSITVSIYEQGALQTTSVIPLGGDHVTNDIAIGFRTSSEEAERVKVKFGHAYLDEASDEEMFKISVIGSNSATEYSQFELAHIIEPRMEEMFDLIDREVRRLGYDDLPGGYVLTGGAVMLPGVLELAREILQNNVRIATPDYIGVRESQYTTGVGLIQFAHRNGRVMGREVAASVSVFEEEKPSKKKEKPVPKANGDNGMKNKVKGLYKMFFGE